MRQRSGRRDERGVALVEFALVLPVLIMILLGLITGGLVLNEKQQMTYATREGARYAATIPAGQPFASGTWATNVRDLIVQRSDGALSAADVCVALVEGNAPATAIAAADPDGPTGPLTAQPTTYHSTEPGAAACIPGQTYPTSPGDSGRRVQVTTSKPAEIQLGLFGVIDVTLDVDATAQTES